MTLGERIKKIRLSKNITLDDMANKLGYSNRSAFYKIENGYGITLDKLKNIALALEVPFEELLYDDEDYLDAKEVIKKAEEANLIDDILFAVYGIHKDTYYDCAIIAPSWYPEKIFGDEDNIILLKKASYNSSYEIYTDNLKIAYIQCGSGASNLTDCMLCLTNANIKKIFFIGAVGSIDKNIEIASLVTPSKCISFDGVTPFFKKQFEKKMYGSEIIPYGYSRYIERKPEARNRPLSTNEKTALLKQWQKLVSSKNPKLLKDIKGQSWIVQIFSSSNRAKNFYYNQPDTITFQWKQIADPSNVIIYGEGGYQDFEKNEGTFEWKSIFK